ncbi:hypothetical protein F4861DRAFT_87543 [Xylaria intraflava]|nr:hypothetical protein F4861DRAFT_87543 [Xylaria intraflava]
MAGTNTAAKTAVPQTSRPYNGIFLLIFIAASAYSAWAMRIDTAINGIPVNFVEQVEARTYPDGTPMRTHYTGIEAIDSALLFLVASFIAGPLSWDKGVRMQQQHFLVQFFAVVAVWNVEACRKRHARRIVSFTGLFVLFYQTVAGAAIIPLYYLFHTILSKPDAYYTEGRSVSLPYARGLLFSITVGYLVPTLALYAPGLSASTAQFLTFLWQPSPGFVNILLFTSSLVLPDTAARTDKTPDVKHLKRIYTASGIVCAVNHLMTMYICATSSDPQFSFSYVFVPNRDTWAQSTTIGLHYIFQVDWWGCFLPTLLWCWIAVYDVHRLLLGGAGAAQLAKWAVYIVGLTVALGPGGMIAIVWRWREDRLVMIESGVRGTIRKPKSA